jgi:adenylate cyclase
LAKVANRRLAAILAADVVSFSALMERDEEGTLARIQRLREHILDPRIGSHNGRLVKTTGDGFLVEFASPVQAVRCAMELQEALAGEAVPSGSEKPLAMRIGINLGDIIIDESGDIYGDGVNVAARLEQRSEPGSICISGAVYDQIEATFGGAFEAQGEQQVKNIARPIRVYSLARSAFISCQDIDLALPDKPSIAVLPFSTPAGETQDAFAADGFVEDLILALSRNHQLFVIARNSTFTYKGRTVDARQVARELGVRYVVEGNLRPLGDQYRVNVELIDGLDGRHVWAEKYETSRDLFFQEQDNVLRSVAASLQTHITLHEGEDSPSRPKHPHRANELLKKAWTRIYQLTPEALSDAQRLAEAALAQSPTNDRAHQVLAICHHHNAYFGYAPDWLATVEVAHREACRAIEIYEPDEYSHWILGSTFVLKREHERAMAEYARAVEINPNCSMAFGSMGTALAWAGKAEQALRVNEIAIRSNPRDPSIFLRFFVNGLAHFTAGELHDARGWFARTTQRKKTFRNAHLMYIASLALCDDRQGVCQARKEMQQHFPQFSEQQLQEFPFIRESDAQRLEQGLRAAELLANIELGR